MNRIARTFAALMVAISGSSLAMAEEQKPIYCPEGTVPAGFADIPFTTEPFAGKMVSWRGYLPGFPKRKDGVIKMIEICTADGKVVVHRQDDGTGFVELHVPNEIGEQRTSCQVVRGPNGLEYGGFCDPGTKVTDAQFDGAVQLARDLQAQIIAPEVPPNMLITFK